MALLPGAVVAPTCSTGRTITLTWALAVVAWPLTIKSRTRFFRSIHNLENAYFRNKFEDELPKFKGTAGIGVISDTSFLCRYFKQHTGQTPQQFRIGQAEHPLL